MPPIHTKLSYVSDFKKCTMPLHLNQELSILVNLLTFGCSFRWRAPFFNSIDIEYLYPVPCSFRMAN